MTMIRTASKEAKEALMKSAFEFSSLIVGVIFGISTIVTLIIAFTNMGKAKKINIWYALAPTLILLVIWVATYMGLYSMYLKEYEAGIRDKKGEPIDLTNQNSGVNSGITTESLSRIISHKYSRL